MKCPNCGEELAEGQAFCGMCGTRVPTTKRCIKCGQELPLAMRFCGFCGTNQDAPSGGGNGGGGVGVGLSMGDKNTIAGDVIGSKDETHISGNATIIKNEDETKKVARCHVCGSNILRLDGYDCPSCGEFTCPSCFNKQKGVCNTCAENQILHAEQQYKTAVIECLQDDDRIDASEFEKLRAIQVQLGLNDFRAMQLQEEVRNKSRHVTTLSTFEKLNMEKATKVLYEDGKAVDALSLVKPIYEAHQDDDSVRDLYLSALLEVDPDAVHDVVDNARIDEASIYKAAINLAFRENRLDEAERKIDMAARIWPDDMVISCYKVLFNLVLAKEFSSNEWIAKGEELLGQFGTPKNKLEKSWQFKTQMLIQDAKGEKAGVPDASFCSQNDLYTAFMKKNPLKGQKSSEPTVGPGLDFSSIQEAIDYVDAGAVIHVTPGVYKETLNISKPVSIIGIENEDDFEFLPPSKLPVIVSEPFATNTVGDGVTITGVVFTNTADLNFENLLSLEKVFKANPVKVEGDTSLLAVTGKADLKGIAVVGASCNGITITGNSGKLSDSFICYCAGTGAICAGNTGFTIDECSIRFCGADGVCLKDSAAPLINSCGIFTNTDVGIRVKDSASGTVKETGICSNTGNGIRCQDCSAATFTNCDIANNKEEGSQYNGIGISESSKPVFDGCTVKGHLGNGVRFADNSSGILKDCVIEGNALTGLYIDGESKPRILSTTVKLNKHAGIYVCGTAAPELVDVKIADNKTDGRFFAGLEVVSPSRFTAKGLDISGSLGSGMYIYKDAAPEISDSKVHGCGTQGIQVSENAAGTYTNCEFFKNMKSGVWTRNDTSPLFSKCKIYENDNCAIDTDDNSRGKFLDCEIYKNTHAGAYVHKNSAPTFSTCNIYSNKTEGKRYPGMEVTDSAHPTVIMCDIHHHVSNGIWVHENAGGSYSGSLHDNGSVGFSNQSKGKVVNNCK